MLINVVSMIHSYENFNHYNARNAITNVLDLNKHLFSVKKLSAAAPHKPRPLPWQRCRHRGQKWIGSTAPHKPRPLPWQRCRHRGQNGIGSTAPHKGKSEGNLMRRLTSPVGKYQGI